MFDNDSFKMLNTYILINFIKIKVNGEKVLNGGILYGNKNLNIRLDNVIKNQAEEIFNELGLNMTTAAIEEGRKMMSDPSAPRYSSMDALKAALEV